MLLLDAFFVSSKGRTGRRVDEEGLMKVKKEKRKKKKKKKNQWKKNKKKRR